MERLIVAARTVGPLSPGEDHEAWARACLLEFDGAFPADEPLFLLRGQDMLARSAIDEYADAARRTASLSPNGEAHYQAVLGVSDEFGKFALSHPDRMKVPD